MQKIKMHTEEIEIDESLVKRLVTVQFPEWAELPGQQVTSSGTDNALFRLGSDKVVRLPRIYWAVDQISLEWEWLPKLAPHLPLPISKPLALGSPTGEYAWNWAIYQWIEGEIATYEHIAEPLRFAKELGEFILALQRVDTVGIALSTNRGVPLIRRDRETCKAIDSCKDILSDTINNTSLTIWKTSLQLPAWRNPPVWTHADLQAGNLLVREGQLSAVIDFGCMGVGDPACELIVAWNLFTAEMREVLKETLKVDEATWLRGRAWALSVAFIALPYYVNTSPTIANASRRTIMEAVNDYLTD